MSKRSDRYKDSPTLKRDDDSGKMKATKKPTEAQQESAKVNAGTAGMMQHEEGVPATARHAMDRMQMHHKHQLEHHAHDHAMAGDKKEMHARHEKEMSEMHKRHEKESTKGSGGGQEKINKIDGGSY